MPGNSHQTGKLKIVFKIFESNLCINVYSNTGKRLMAKCRLLYQENEELGKIVNSGRIAKLEGELALQKNFSEEVKKSQSGNGLMT